MKCTDSLKRKSDLCFSDLSDVRLMSFTADARMSAYTAVALIRHSSVSAEKRIMDDMENRKSQNSGQKHDPYNFTFIHDESPLLT